MSNIKIINANCLDIIDEIVHNVKNPIIVTEYNKSHNNMYFNLYGDIGKRLLIKWLNRLNRTDIDIDTLIVEFKTDIASAKLYLEGNKDYERSKAYHLELDAVLIRVLERYSPRGKYFHTMYYKDLDKQMTM